jgi:4-hydroxymandelate oxidase
VTEELPGTLADLAARAERVMDPGAYGYYAGGAGDEVTLAENVAAWQRVGLRQRVLVDVARRDVSVPLLGRDRPTPFVAAPMAFQRTVHPGGEPELARGAAAGGAIYCMSTLSTCGLGELAREAPDVDRWFQLYVFRDRGLARDVVAEAETTGFSALVVTADLPVLGRRDRDVRSGFALPVIATMPSAAAGARGHMTPAEFADLIDPSLTWDDLADLVAGTSLPVLVKGVLEPDDARRAVDAGVAGVVVSNHGGRQLDTVAPTAEALPAVVDAVRDAAGDRVDVLVDGGIRRGGDVAKALAMGANAVGIGRPLAWGLAVGGAAGVQRVLEVLRAELDLALALTGVPRARDLRRSALR